MVEYRQPPPPPVNIIMHWNEYLIYTNTPVICGSNLSSTGLWESIDLYIHYSYEYVEQMASVVQLCPVSGIIADSVLGWFSQRPFIRGPLLSILCEQCVSSLRTLSGDWEPIVSSIPVVENTLTGCERHQHGQKCKSTTGDPIISSILNLPYMVCTMYNILYN